MFGNDRYHQNWFAGRGIKTANQDEGTLPLIVAVTLVYPFHGPHKLIAVLSERHPPAYFAAGFLAQCLQDEGANPWLGTQIAGARNLYPYVLSEATVCETSPPLDVLL